MRFEVACHTDAGIYKRINQDSACAVTAILRGVPFCMLVLCDGMGGASQGEYASRRVVTEFVRWFEQELPALEERKQYLPAVRPVWAKLLTQLDEELRAYGRRHGIKLGTTATCMLFRDTEYLLAQSGDSRAYEIRRKAVQLTEDQSYVQQQVRMGLLTPEEARRHPRRNVLTDCIGGSRPSVPVTVLGQTKRNAVYLLCSDGLVHETENRELASVLSLRRCRRIPGLQEGLAKLTEQVKRRGETDNITAVGMYAGNVPVRKRKMKESGFALTEKLIAYEGEGEAMETSGEEKDG